MKLIKSSCLMSRLIAILLVFLIFQSGFQIQAIEGAHKKELKELIEKYENQNYDEIITRLEQLLNKIGEDEASIRGQFFLLLGAAYEGTGEKDKAVENYLLGDLLLDRPEINGVDLKSLPVFNNTIYGKVVNGNRVFEKIGKRKKKKKFPYIALIGVAAITIAVFLLMKKKSHNQEPTRPERFANDIFNQIEWVTIPAGEFKMGDVNNMGEDDERPAHTVFLSSYKISKREITFEQFDKYTTAQLINDMASEGWGRETRPVINVRWGEAELFCEWVTKYTGKIIKLPTEAQWEKAAIGTTQVIYPWGNETPNCSRSNYNNCIGITQPVGSYPLDISVYGVLDMGGNVSELVRDAYQADYYSISPYNDPEGPDTADTNSWVVRGGNWNSSDLRASNRSTIGAFSRNEMTGFRIVWLD